MPFGSEVGDQATSGNTETYFVYGEGSGRQIAGASTPEEFQLSVYSAPEATPQPARGATTNAETETLIKMLRDAPVGAAFYVAVVGDVADDAQEAVFMITELASKARVTPLQGGPAQWRFTFAITQAPLAVDQA